MKVLLRIAAISAAVLCLAGVAPARTERVVLAGGCFWGMQAVFEQLHGVTSVVAG
jgi:peptide-methionine (S)-S-oxide reductase